MHKADIGGVVLFHWLPL